jgi:hypothetical protein
MRINGVLYRVITESRDEDHLGTIGIRLHSWSATPPGYTKGSRVIAQYIDRAVEHQINDGLLNKAVEAGMLIRTPRPGTSFDPKKRTLLVEYLEPGPGERDHYLAFDVDVVDEVDDRADEAEEPPTVA